MMDFWNIKARIIRRWKQHYRLDMLLIDEKGQKIQASVKEQLMEQFDKDIQEDAVVVIKKCGVAEQKDHFPVILLEKKINFYKCTQVSPAVAFRGHPYGFSFKNFPDIDEKMLKEVHTVDVIGNVVSCGSLDVFKKKTGKETKKINFDLQDLQGNVVHCAVWDGYAEHFSAYISTHTSNEHVISVIQHGKLKVWRGSMTVQNDMFGTRLFLNDEIEEINTFRRSLILNEAGVSTSQSQLSSQTNYLVRTEFIVNCRRKHVDELREADEEGTYVVLGKITLLDAMVNKLIAFKVGVTSHHLKKTYHVHTVAKVCDDPAVIAEFVSQDAVHEVVDDQETMDGSTVKLDESSQLGVDSKDAVSITGSSLGQDIEKDSETSPLGKRPIQAVGNPNNVAGDCSAMKRTRKKLVKYDV